MCILSLHPLSAKDAKYNEMGEICRQNNHTGTVLMTIKFLKDR